MSLDQLPRIALIQMEVEPGRPDRNVQRMLHFVDRARERQAEIVVFSELCIPGYIVGDVWEVDALVEDYAAWSESLRAASEGLTIVFGNVAVDSRCIGEDGRLRKYNAVYVCHDGDYVQRTEGPGGLPHGVHPKTLHPNYRFFDDDRHFYSLRKLAGSQGRSVYDWVWPYRVRLRGGQSFAFGVQLCEDIWCQDYTYDGETLDTVRVYRERGACAVFNLSASPWTWQKNDKRNRVVREVLARSPLPFFYVNQVGAQNNGKNILVFDGDTTAYSPDGRVLHRARPWTEEMIVTGGAPQAGAVQAVEEAFVDGVVTGLKHLDCVRGRENRFLIGVSGGVDSSVVLCLLVKAFGPQRVYAVNMPTRFNAEITQDNARRLCAALGVEYLSCPIHSLYDQLAKKIECTGFPSAPGQYTRLVDENLQARIRGADILAGLAAKLDLVFTNNGNKTETALGYATLYGDVNGAVAPIADLYKSQIFDMARHLNERVFLREVIPSNLYDGTTVPSAELSEAQDVTKGLGDPIKYDYHDAVLRSMIEFRRHPLDFLRWFADGVLLERIQWPEQRRFRAYFNDTRAWVEDLEWVAGQLRINYFKRIQAPPIIVLSKRAFGFDLRESQLPAYSPRAYQVLRRRVLDMPIAEPIATK